MDAFSRVGTHLKGATGVLHGEPERDLDLPGRDDGAADLPRMEGLGGRAGAKAGGGEPPQGAESPGIRAEGEDDTGARSTRIQVGVGMDLDSPYSMDSIYSRQLQI